MVVLLNAQRGTRLYKRLQQEGRLVRNIIGDGTETNLIPKMGYRELREGYGYVVTSIYSPRYFYKRLITFLSNYELPNQKRLHRPESFGP
jgi:hypothetical protein